MPPKKQSEVAHQGANSSAGVSVEAVRGSVERILASDLFAGSQTLSRLLRHIVERTLEGKTDLLKEYTLGIDVLGRADTFDPRTDAAVRIQASRLRAKLASYYRGQGARDSLRIELPRGAYVPVFQSAPKRSVFRLTLVGRKTAIFAAIVVALMVTVWQFDTLPVRGKAGIRTPPARVALLPFVSLSPGTVSEQLSRQITSEVMNTLARVQGLDLVGRSSSLQFKGRNATAGEVGRQLNVGSVVDGSVRIIGNRTRVAAHLIGTKDGLQFWSQAWDRPLNEAFVIPEEIGRGISFALNFPPPGEGPFWNRRSKSPDAYRLVLMARYLEPTTGDTADTKIGYYRAAIERDHLYAAPWVGIADTWCRLANAGTRPPGEAMEKAREAAERALHLDDGSPDAHFIAACIRSSYEWDWQAADREFRRAIQLDPNSASTRNFYAAHLAHMSRFDEAFAQIELVRKLEPLTSAYNDVEAKLLYLSRQYDRTIQFCESALSTNPKAWALYYWLGRAYGSTGRLKDSVASLQRLYPSSDIRGRGFGMLGAIYAQAGRRADALRLLTQVRERAKRAYVSPVSVAQVYLGLGEPDRAFEWLERGYNERDESMTALKVEPAYDPVRGDPRFSALLRRLKLE